MCRVIAWVALASILACGVSSAPEDASAEADARLGCGSHVECDDEVFCNGVERCEMGEDGVGRCQVGVPPCAAGTSCDERRARCELGCDTDADGDGYVAVASGGDDCDDDDPAIHPGATEVCDPDHVDEDCDPTTVGDRDADGDGWIDAACCNWHLGLLRCGEDCDDTAANVNPAAPEVCDGVDNDCDGRIDEGVAYTLWPDADRDSFGDETGAPFQSCQFMPGHALVGGDCDDTTASINPGMHDVCNGLDDDCDGRVDEGADDFCRAALGVEEAICVHLGGEPAPRCVVTRCAPTRIDCNHDPSDGCEADFCDDLEHCGDCGGYGGACSFGYCAAGRCAPTAPSLDLAAGTVRRDLDLAPIEGARVARLRECGAPTVVTSAASGEYSLVWDFNPPRVRMRTEAEGYVPQVDGPQSWGDIRLLTTDELEAALAASPVPVDRRLGIVVADVLEAAVDLAAPIFGTFRAPEIPSSPPYAVALPDGRTRIVFVNVRPGVARVRANRVGDARRAVYCAEQAGGPNDAPTYYDAVVTVDAIVHVRFGVCGVLLVGG